MDEQASILAADVGGTNARFAYLTPRPNGGWDVDGFSKVRVTDFATFTDALNAFVSLSGEPASRLAICAAGVVRDQIVKLTNADWTINAKSLMEKQGLSECVIVNDFAAMTRSVPELDPSGFTRVKSGEAEPDFPQLICGPGTGFGAGYLVPIKNGYHVLPGEGGHSAYAPLTDDEMQLTRILRDKFGYVSTEQISSGSGLDAVHEAICDMHGKPYERLEPQQIALNALASDPVCIMVCEIRAAATLSAAGSLALVGGCRGGVTLAGGVSERMINFFKTDKAVARFTKRGPRTAYMQRIPIRVMHIRTLH